VKLKLRYLLILSFVFFGICLNAQLTTEVFAPGWVTKRPVNNSKFIGIGVADKNSSNNYQGEAKKNALFDLSSEIKVDISTNSILYTVQNNNQFNENFNSLIKLSSSDNIEGYRLVDAYENDKQYWLYYELDKAEYENLKLQKKLQTIARAVNIINLSFDDEKNGNFTGSLKKRIQAFGILSPYLNEELNFESSNNVKNIFELSNLIQKQIQSISIVNSKTISVIKPYQPTYKPLVYKFVIKGKNPLVDFPFKVKSDNESVRVNETASTNQLGELEISLNKVKPLNQEIYFTLNPDIDKLMQNDSVSKSSIILLKQFIETSQLKAFAKVSPITVFVNCNEKNNSKANEQKIIEPIIKSKFMGEEVKIVEQKVLADFIIDVDANTQKDISSDILNSTYNVQLSFLKVKISLRNSQTSELIYSNELSDIYGYGNSQETAGFNSYQSDKLKIKLSEALFFLKRKLIVY
jgi:hypothetical protein